MTFIKLSHKASFTTSCGRVQLKVNGENIESILRTALVYGDFMEQEYKKLAEKLCKDKACRIQYCLQGVFIHLCNLIGSDLTRWFDQHIAHEL